MKNHKKGSFKVKELSSEHISFFKENGYLVLRNVLDKNLCAEARDRMWSALPADSSLARDEPNTYKGPFSKEETSKDPLHIREGYLWQLRECGTEKLMIDLVYSDRLCVIAEQLLGQGMLTPPIVGGEPMGSRGTAWPDGPTDPAIGSGIRGIYFTRPRDKTERLTESAHTDGHPFNLGLVGLIDDVPPDGGAFKVWPGSHKRLYPTFQMQYDQPRIPYYEHLPSHKGIVHSPEYVSELAKVMSDTNPVDCWGETGDVVLWHHRLAHMASHNYSDTIRQAVLYDFTRKDLDICRTEPPQENMWRDWSEEINKNAGSYSKDFALTQIP